MFEKGSLWKLEIPLSYPTYFFNLPPLVNFFKHKKTVNWGLDPILDKISLSFAFLSLAQTNFLVVSIIFLQKCFTIFDNCRIAHKYTTLCPR